MKRTLLLAIAVFVFTTSPLLAELIRDGIDIDFVTIGNAGNAGDTGGVGVPYGCGAVSYNYRIGKYEVSNAQWNAFTAVAGTPTGNDGDFVGDAYDQSALFNGTNVPTNNVSWYEAAQFCNYLTSGDKSQGAYLFSGNNANPGYFQGINRTAAQTTYGTVYVIPTEDEWYKAAYFKPNGSGYSWFANGTNSAPRAGVQSNYSGTIGIPWNITNGTQEQNGTFNMMGNVWEWNETLIFGNYRGYRGGFYGSESSGSSLIMSSYHSSANPYGEGDTLGFRIASIPEPCTLLLLGLGGLLIKKR